MTDSTVASAVYTLNMTVVKEPTYNPGPGTYTTIQNVTLDTKTNGASIRFTTDGTTPSSTVGTLYTAPVSISNSTTFKAVAYKSGMANSPVVTGAYVINLPVVAAPSFAPPGGSYTSVQNVTITSSTSGATIRYTTDGSTPTELVGTIYTAPVSIGSSITLKAIAYKSGMTTSTVTSAVYTVNLPQVATPSFSPVPGTYTSARTVTIGSATAGASIRYTTDGSTPTPTVGTVYSGPVTIAVTSTLKAIAYKSGMLNSGVASGTYTIAIPTAATPWFSPSSGTYTNNQTVAIGSATSGASIRYTTDGTTPTSSVGTLYSGPVSIGATTTLRAVAYKSGFLDSNVGIAAYTLQAAVPVLNPAPGTYPNAQSVTITSATSGASIRYTTDGSTPTETNGLLYSGPVGVNVATMLRAVAYKAGYADSAVSGGNYSLLTAAPVFGVEDATAHTVRITSATVGATIRYTTDGSIPSETNGTLYTGPITISGQTALAAVAYATGISVSSVSSANISIPSVTITTPANGSTINGP